MRGRHVRPIGHRDEDLRAFHTRRDALDQRQEREVEEHDAILRVLDDVRELIDMQPWVERMQHGARSRHGKVKLHMAVAIPCERPYPLALLDTEGRQRGELTVLARGSEDYAPLDTAPDTVASVLRGLAAGGPAAEPAWDGGMGPLLDTMTAPSVLRTVPT